MSDESAARDGRLHRIRPQGGSRTIAPGLHVVATRSQSARHLVPGAATLAAAAAVIAEDTRSQRSSGALRHFHAARRLSRSTTPR